VNPIELSLFANRLRAACDEMGATLRSTALSPNIRDRLDYSCAAFDARGKLCAQAAHIPVHLGSMAYAMADLVSAFQWRAGDMILLNDPFLGGTHLPDVTLVAPLLWSDRPCAFVACRAHHADIGCEAPGSMPVATTLDQEGVVLAPRQVLANNEWRADFREILTDRFRNPPVTDADFKAQKSANLAGIERLSKMIEALGERTFQEFVDALNASAEHMVRSAIAQLPRGRFSFEDYLDDDGAGTSDIRICATITIDGDAVDVDFTGTAQQVRGNVNCPLSVTAAAVYYALHCLMPPDTPACAGAFRPITIRAPRGCLLNASRPAAVAAGNVETSQRIVDVLLGALAQADAERVAAASHGSMNNVAMGGDRWDYYETIGGGMGAHRNGPGLDAVQTHMTNTRNTPIEVVEAAYPLRIREYRVRDGSGGAGRHRGGHGIVREYEFLEPAEVTLLTERRTHAPWGLAGGSPGACGQNLLNGRPLPAKIHVPVRPGDRLTIASAGGGGFGTPSTGQYEIRE
jgi:N-methylhydantoinase B